MKTPLAVLAITSILVSAVWAVQSDDEQEFHGDCLSKADVIWHQDRSKSGIPRVCTYSSLQHNLERMVSQ